MSYLSTHVLFDLFMLSTVFKFKKIMSEKDRIMLEIASQLVLCKSLLIT